MLKNNKIDPEIAKKDNKNSDVIYCEGDDYPYDHPRVYLEIPNGQDKVVCPYCGKVFKKKGAK